MTEANGESDEVEQLRADIAETRADMAETVESIQQRLRPSNVRQRLVRRTQQRLKEVWRVGADRLAGLRTDLSSRAEQVPAVPVIGAGLGLVTLATGGAVARHFAVRRAAVRLQRRRRADQAVAASAASVVAVLAALGKSLRRHRSVKIRQVMTPDVVTAFSTDPLMSVAEKMARLDIGAMPVLSPDGRLEGMLSDRDIVVQAVARGDDPRIATASDVVQRPVVTVGADEPVDTALRVMRDHAVRRLPVVDGDTLVGVVAQADLAVHLAGEAVGEVVEDISRVPADRTDRATPAV